VLCGGAVSAFQGAASALMAGNTKTGRTRPNAKKQTN
jgi:hypothetical protein